MKKDMIKLPPVIVSSTTAFADTWEPFVVLLERYWPAHPQVYLVTERPPVRAPESLIPVVTNVPVGPSYWSEGMAEALRQIAPDYFLYMQDDYFVRGPVNPEILASAFQLFRGEDQASALRVRETQNSGPWRKYPRRLANDGDVWEVDRRSPYLCSLQAAFWRAGDFLDLLRMGESPWEFERSGSVRARRRDATMLCLSIDEYRGTEEPLPYLATGIIKGSWHPEVPDLFQSHGLERHLYGREVMTEGESINRSKRIIRYLRRWLR